MWVADMDFQSPPPVLDALRQRIEHGVFGYALPNEALVCTVLETLANNYRWEVEPEWIVWLPGLVTGLNVVCRSVGTDGDDVISATPIYPPFLTAPGLSGRNLLTVPMHQVSGRWVMDMDRLASVRTKRSRLFLLCNPHNPCGRIFSRTELESLAEFCLEHDIILCSDEIHCDLRLEDREHIPIATLAPEIRERTVTLMAPSKTYNIPGLGCSFAIIANPEIRARFKAEMRGIVPDVNALGLTACEAAYRHGEQWLQGLLSYLRRNRDLVREAIEDGMFNVSGTVPEATYLAWIDIRETGLTRPVAYFENHGVGLSDGRFFGMPGFVRLNFGCPRSVLETGLQRLKAAVQKL